MRHRHADPEQGPRAASTLVPARVVAYPDPSDETGGLRQSAHANIIVETSGVCVFDEPLEEAVLDLRALTGDLLGGRRADAREWPSGNG